MSGFTPDFNVSIVKQKLNINHPKVGQSLEFINQLTIKMSKHIPNFCDIKAKMRNVVMLMQNFLPV